MVWALAKIVTFLKLASYANDKGHIMTVVCANLCFQEIVYYEVYCLFYQFNISAVCTYVLLDGASVYYNFAMKVLHFFFILGLCFQNIICNEIDDCASDMWICENEEAILNEVKAKSKFAKLFEIDFSWNFFV